MMLPLELSAGDSCPTRWLFRLFADRQQDAKCSSFPESGPESDLAEMA